MFSMNAPPMDGNSQQQVVTQAKKKATDDLITFMSFGILLEIAACGAKYFGFQSFLT